MLIDEKGTLLYRAVVGTRILCDSPVPGDMIAWVRWGGEPFVTSENSRCSKRRTKTVGTRG